MTLHKRARLMTMIVAGISIWLAGATAVDAQDERISRRLRQSIVRIGQNYVLPAGTEIRHAVVVLGSATISGRVSSDVFVWLGDVRLESSAEIGGSLVVVGGSASVQPGAILDGDLAVFGGTINAPPDFAPGREQVLVGTPALGAGLRGVIPWVTRGLLWGRLIVPDLPWVWVVVGIFFLIAVVLNHLFATPVRAAAEAVIERPFGTLLAGMLVMLVAAPVLVIVSATIIGLVLLPIVLCAALVAWMLGKVGIARGIGIRLAGEEDPDSGLQSLRSLVIGFAIITLAYMVPVLGVITWSLVAVFSLGAATIATVGALRREYPPAPPPPPAEPPPPAPVEPSDTPADADLASRPPPPGAPSPPASGPASPPSGSLLAFGRAGFLDRTAAFALDCIVVAVAVRLLDFRQDGVFFVVLLVYHIAFWTWQGTTLGGIITSVRLVRTDGGDLRPVDAVVRGLSAILSFIALGIGLFWMLGDPERQMWHDKIAGTYAVKVPRNYPLR